MGLIYNNKAEWELIHSAYGVTIEGKFGAYEYCYEGVSYKVIQDISINGRQLYLGNHCINADHREGIINMEDDKDLLCWMFAHREKEMDDYEFERFFFKEYSGSLWRTYVQHGMQRERFEAKMRKVQEERKAKEQELLDEYKAYADKKKLHMVKEYDTVYFIKLTGKNAKVADKFDDAYILDFARKYPGNGCDIVETREVAV